MTPAVNASYGRRHPVELLIPLRMIDHVWVVSVVVGVVAIVVIFFILRLMTQVSIYSPTGLMGETLSWFRHRLTLGHCWRLIYMLRA